MRRGDLLMGRQVAKQREQLGALMRLRLSRMAVSLWRMVVRRRRGKVG